MTKKYQVIVSMALMLFVSFKLKAQQPDFLFMQHYPDDWCFSGVDVLEIDSDGDKVDSFYLLASCNIDLIGFGYAPAGEKLGKVQSPTEIPGKILKISACGELIGELDLGANDAMTTIVKLYQNPIDSDYCLALGFINHSGINYSIPFLAKFNHDLNLQWLREIELPAEYHNYFYGARSMMDSSNDIVFCTSLVSTTTEYVNLLYSRFSTEGELLSINKSQEETLWVFGGHGGLFEYQDGSGDYGQIVRGKENINPTSMLIRMDRNFSVRSSRLLQKTVRLSETESLCFLDHHQSQAFSLPDGSVFIGCSAEHDDGYNIDLLDEVTVAMRLDENDSITNLSFTPHDNDSARKMAFNQAVDMTKEGSFYLCNSVFDRLLYDFYMKMKGENSIELTKTNANANIIWRRFYQDGEHTFQPFSVTATNDEGCIVTGRCWKEPYSEAKVFVIKFFPDGTLSIPEMEEFVRPYAYYPNPVQSELHLQYSPDVTPTQIELYDLQGRLARSQRNGLESLNLEGLSSGAYTMRVTLEDGKVFSDKVVKE